MYERSLNSNDYPLVLYSECSGGSPAATVEPYLIFDNNIYVGDPHQDWCIYDTLSFDTTQKTKEECAALCNAWFDCRAFQASSTDVGDCRLYESAWNRVANCTGGTSLSPLTLFLYKSSYPYTRLDNTFCPASNSPIISLENMSIEACKAACFALEGCFSMKHEGDGDCELYGTTEFSSDCVDTQRDLYISYERFLEQAPDSIVPLYGQCIATVSLAAGQDTEETCEAQCITDPSCRGYALQAGKACHFFDSNVASQLSIEPCNVAGAVVAIKYSTNPYVKAPGACLSEPMPGHSFVDKTYVECMAICEAQSFCRHFSIADISGRGSGVCQLYLAQVGDIADNCPQSNVTAYINTRSFIDQITWLGIPERIFTAISGISYRECAATCSLLDDCNAFLHDTNRRRSPGFEDELAEPARIISVNFESSSLVPVIWSLDVNDNIVPSIDATDDDYSDQKLILETISGCDEEDSICLVHLRFWFRDLCLVLENESDISTQPCNVGDAREEWEKHGDGDNFFFAKQGRCIRTTPTNIDLVASCDDPLTRVQLASLPTKLTRDEDVASSSCLSAVSPTQSGFDVNLEDCQKVDARTSWTYLFGSRQWITVGVSRTISGSETERLYDGYRQKVGTPNESYIDNWSLPSAYRSLIERDSSSGSPISDYQSCKIQCDLYKACNGVNWNENQSRCYLLMMSREDIVSTIDSMGTVMQTGSTWKSALKPYGSFDVQIPSPSDPSLYKRKVKERVIISIQGFFNIQSKGIRILKDSVYRILKSTTEEDCARHCEDDPTCVGFEYCGGTFDGQGCTLNAQYEKRNNIFKPCDSTLSSAKRNLAGETCHLMRNGPDFSEDRYPSTCEVYFLGAKACTQRSLCTFDS